jgi:regulator of telomere elongation helicase 1
VQEAYAELKAERAKEGVGLPTVIYSSRTHSQLAQVMRELGNTSYRPRTAVLGSRQQGCLHPVVKAMSGAVANQACRALVARRGCKWWALHLLF